MKHPRYKPTHWLYALRTNVFEQLSPARILHDEEDAVAARERVLQVHQERMPKYQGK